MAEPVIKGYHAHIYYDPAKTRDAAARVRAGLANFEVQIGRWHDEPVGPHLDAMYQAVFTAEEFGKVAVSSDAKEGTTAFLEKRPAAFKGE